jgi:hypothetical protein
LEKCHSQQANEQDQRPAWNGQTKEVAVRFRAIRCAAQNKCHCIMEGVIAEDIAQITGPTRENGIRMSLYPQVADRDGTANDDKGGSEQPIETATPGLGIMQCCNQKDQAGNDNRYALEDAQWAWLKFHDVLQKKRGGHGKHASQEGQQVEWSGSQKSRQGRHVGS